MRKTENIAPISTRFIYEIREKIAPFLLRILLAVQFTFAPSEVGKSNANVYQVKELEWSGLGTSMNNSEDIP